MNLVDLYLEYLPPSIAELLGRALDMVFATAPYWLPVALLFLAVDLWYRAMRATYIAAMDWALLEVRLPTEILKSPAAMEVAYTIFHQTSTGTWYDRWWKGRVIPWFSLELVSLEGSVHFFIRTERRFSKLIEAHIYAQYPEVQITEVDDYVKSVNYSPESEWKLHGLELQFTKPDAYPIKTYIDYELDKERREDASKVDPIASTIEFLGSVGKDEQIWIQILVRASQPRFRVKDSRFKKQSWKDEGIALVKELRKRETKPGEMVLYHEKLLSPGEERVMKGIQRNLGKLGFDCGIRAIYFGKGDAFQKMRIPGLIMSFKQYNAEDSNGFKPHGEFKTDFDYPWQDYKNIRLNRKKRKIFNAYRLRSYFYGPYPRHPFVLSSEELATIYHFPGAVLRTPTFHRVLSKTSEAPGNLPR